MFFRTPFIVQGFSDSWVVPTQTRQAICFLWSTDPAVGLLQEFHHRHTQDYHFVSYFSISWLHQSSMKLTITVYLFLCSVFTMKV